MTDTTITDEGGHDRTEPVDIQIEMQRSYIDYAMSVIVGLDICRAPAAEFRSLRVVSWVSGLTIRCRGNGRRGRCG